MTKYKVLPIAMSVKNNRLAKSGEVVDDSELQTNASDLIRDEFIRLLTDEELSELKAEIVDSSDLDEDPEKENKEKGDDAKALLESRRNTLIELGFVAVDSEDLVGLSLPDTNVLFSNEDISNASLEEFDTFVSQATPAKEVNIDDSTKDDNTNSTKVEEVKKDEVVSKKDEVKASLTKK